nr:reverse transcriptase domain-containing protein [Tanacetum cinerariifolium]
MSDSDESGVTYTDISSPFEELSDIGSPTADDHEHLMLPEMLEDPYPEQAPPSPDYIPGPEHADDEIVVEGQPYAEDASPIAQSPELLAISSPPASPLSPWSSPPPQIPFPPLPPILSPPSPVLSSAPPPSLIRSLGYRAAMIRLRDKAASTSSPPLQLPSASRRDDRPEVTLPPQKRLGIALGPRYEVGESSSTATARPAGGLRADYGFVSTVDREIMHDPERETERQLLVGRLNMLFRDRRAYAYTRHLMETEARMSREAWVRATDASDLVHGEVMSLRTTILGQMSEIRELHAADRRRQTVILELLRIDHRRSTEITKLRTTLQGQVTALQGQKQMEPRRTARSTADQETINATSVTNAQLQAMIDQGVTAALAACDALRSTNGDDSYNSGTGTVGHEAAYGMTWKTLMKMMTEKYCPRNEIRKLEMELWDLKVKDTDLTSYTQHFQELALLCGRMFSEESNKIEKYVGGQKAACYECGVQGHYKRECPKLKNNNNHGNQGGRNNAPARVYAVGHAGTDPDANVVM